MVYWLPILCCKNEVSYCVIKGKEILSVLVPKKSSVTIPLIPVDNGAHNDLMDIKSRMSSRT
eukprot:8904480-Heterocapsa_arctica.AAC.1